MFADILCFYIFTWGILTQQKMGGKNNILYYIGEIPIRKNNTVRLNLNEQEYKKIAQVINNTGLPISTIIAYQGKPCTKCGNDEIMITIPKNLLSTNKANKGRSLTNRLNDDKQA